MTRTIELPHGFTVTAHSGSMGLLENSVEAMEAGVRAGAQIVEFDLRFTDSGEPVLSHDAPQGACPALQDAFAFLAAHPDVRANVDVKDLSFLECVEPLALQAGVLDRIFFTGLDEQTIPTAKKKCPSVPYYLNFKGSRFPNAETLAEKVRALGALGVNIRADSLTPRLTQVFHAQGLLVSVWTIDTKRKARRVLPMCPDNITTRRPDRIRTWLLQSDVMHIRTLRASETWQQAGAYAVRIQGMARQHQIPLRREFDEHDAPDTKYIVLTDKDYPVATCRFYPLDGQAAMIGRVVVLPEYRGRGLGRRVVAEAESWLRDLGYSRAVVESRDVAVDFYQKLGYAVTDAGIIRGDTFDCVRMEKDLPRVSPE